MATASEIQIGQDLLDDLELGEVVDVEEVSGVSMSVLQDGNTVPFKLVVALAWVIRRRSNPEFTFEDARRLKTKDLVDVFVPTPAAPNGSQAAKRRGNS